MGDYSELARGSHRQARLSDVLGFWSDSTDATVHEVVPAGDRIYTSCTLYTRRRSGEELVSPSLIWDDGVYGVRWGRCDEVPHYVLGPPRSRYRLQWLPLRPGDNRRCYVWDRLGEATPNIRIVNVRNIRYTHDSVVRRFADGRSFDELLEKLRDGSVRPLQDRFLTLQPLCVDGVQYSLDNRRLYVLRGHNYGCRCVLWVASVAIDN